MPVTRYSKGYKYPDHLSAEERVIANGELIIESFEVSDEEIEREIEAEARETAIQKITEVEKVAIRTRLSIK